jgi:competence protein ComEA
MNLRKANSVSLVTLALCLALVISARPSLLLADSGIAATSKKDKSASSAAKIDLNTASKEELDALPGIGEANAQKIIDGRPYKLKSDLQNRGILSSSTYDKIRDRVTARQANKSTSPDAATSPKSENLAKPSPSEPKSSSSPSKTANKMDSSTETAQSPPEKGMVWVNLNTRVYHKDGDRWYGKTKKGKFMSESDAQNAGYRPAKMEQAKEGKEQ